MGKTVPSYRLALEWEIQQWKGFRKALQKEREVEAFDALMDSARNHASAGGCATNPILFEPMIMCMVLELQKNIDELKYKLQEHVWQDICKKTEIKNDSQQVEETPKENTQR